MQSIAQNSPPLTGCNLMDASAGSGKTYSITTIFLDLIMKKKLNVSEILVVTFTEAATNELKDRIRRRLREACDRESGVQQSGVQQSGGRQEPLRRALLSMDEAAIFTIHGFCRKILTEHAFESGTFYGTELITDIDDLMKTAYHDYLRTHFPGCDVNMLKLIKSGEYSPFQYENVRKAVEEKLSNPDLRIEPDIKPVQEIQKQAEQMMLAYEDLRKTWKAESGNIISLLKGASLNQKSYKENDLDKFCADMDTFFGGTEAFAVLESFQNASFFDKFTTGCIGKAKTKSSPESIEEHEFFKMCQMLKNMQDTLSGQLSDDGLRHFIELFGWIREKLEQAKVTHSVLTFDDLIISLRNALQSEAGESLKISLAKRFKAVLIDEFQDTDPIQYEIFKTLFFENKEIVSYMIGDPKQSIYAFRGADVFSYINAKKGADTGQITCAPPLTMNYRSDEGLISAVNTIFGRGRKSFVIPEIIYEDSCYPADKKDQKKFSIAGREWKPLEIIHIKGRDPSDLYKGFIRKGTAQNYAADFLVREIASLLSSAAIDKKPIKKSDIAVLVRKNKEARLIKNRLAAARIPAIYYSSESIFGTQECDDLIIFMKAVQEPKNEDLCRQALMTAFFDMSYKEVFDLEKNPAILETLMEKLFHCRADWRRKGFIAMMRSFISDENIKLRLLSKSDGERRMANLSQLLELGQKEAFHRKLDPLGLLTWYKDEQARSLSSEKMSTPPEEHLLRLESDENAVKIVTIHKSKGREFPIVFIPFSWDEVDFKYRKYLKVHERDSNNDSYTVKLCLGKEAMKQHNTQAGREELAENVRLLYVAATRARHKCYIFWGPINGAARSAYSLLFHFRGDLDDPRIFDELGDKDFREQLKTSVEGDLKKLESIDGNIGIRDCRDNQVQAVAAPADVVPAISLEARQMPSGSAIETDFRISSFSGLISGAEREPDLQDYDRSPETDGVERSETDGVNGPESDETHQVKKLTIFDFPGGSKAGSMFHAILEVLDFQEKDEAKLRELVWHTLESYGFDASPWTDIIAETIRNTVAAQLKKDGVSFMLSQISPKERLSELKFLFPVTRLAKVDFKDTLARLDIPGIREKLEGLSFSPFKGYINGAIDCVARYDGKYYLFDWKSNLLGSSPDDYRPEELEKEIRCSWYFLQFSLYTIALDQYLALRLGDSYSYDEHFGGIYYLFIRGMGVKENGIYYSRLPCDTVKSFKEKYIIKKAGV
ncbi:MAG: exodeoxyribonuclease V subunit beta [Vulcanimicrobiota bacterium]